MVSNINNKNVKKSSRFDSFATYDTSDRIFAVIVSILSALMLIIAFYPMWFVLIASISDQGAVYAGKVWLWPVKINFDGYIKILEDTRIITGYRNTIFYTVLGTIISMATTIPCGYALSRKDLPGRNFFTFFFIFTMFFNGGLIPTFLTVNNFGLYDTIWALMIPFCISVYYLVIVKTFYQSSIPDELLEAAQLDGCNNTRFFFQIVLPASKAILAVMALYYAVGNWNSYFYAMIYIKSEELKPLQLVLRDILLSNKALVNTSSTAAAELQKVADSIKYASIVVATVPMLLVYPLIQKYFDKGVMIGAVKG